MRTHDHRRQEGRPRIRRRRRVQPVREHPRLGQHYVVSSTCYDQGTTTASGQPVGLGEVANNFLPLYTRIRLDHPAFGRRDFIVLDHIGWGSELDIYNPRYAACVEWGRREIGFWTLR